MVHQITPRTLAQRLANQNPIHLLDVRQPWESAIAALPNSILIPMAELPQRAGEVPRAEGVDLIIYCHHGIRSMTAARYLEGIGFQNVFSLTGGIDAWSCEVDAAVPRY